MTPSLVHDLGGYLREQRTAAKLSLRQLSELAGISNPYLSQIERGLKKPSAEILQQIARGLKVSAESLYVRAGILEETERGTTPPSVLSAIAADPRLTPSQREVLVGVYRSFVDAAAPTGQAAPTGPTGPGSAAAPTGSAAAPAPAEPARTPARRTGPRRAQPTSGRPATVARTRARRSGAASTTAASAATPTAASAASTHVSPRS